MDRGAWWAAAQRVAKSGARLKPLSWQARAEGRQHKKEKSLESKQKTRGAWLLLPRPFRGTVSVRGHLASDDSPLSPEPPVWTSHSPFSGGALPIAACHHGRCQRTALWTPLLPCTHLRCYLELKGLCLFQTAPSEWSFMSVEVTLLSPQTTFLQPEGGRESPLHHPRLPAGGTNPDKEQVGFLLLLLLSN